MVPRISQGSTQTFSFSTHASVNFMDFPKHLLLEEATFPCWRISPFQPADVRLGQGQFCDSPSHPVASYPGTGSESHHLKAVAAPTTGEASFQGIIAFSGLIPVFAQMLIPERTHLYGAAPGHHQPAGLPTCLQHESI